MCMFRCGTSIISYLQFLMVVLLFFVCVRQGVKGDGICDSCPFMGWFFFIPSIRNNIQHFSDKIFKMIRFHIQISMLSAWDPLLQCLNNLFITNNHE